MDIGSLKNRIETLEKEKLGIDDSISIARREVQEIVNQHNERMNVLTAKRNKLEGKIDVLKEFVGLETPDPKKGK